MLAFRDIPILDEITCKSPYSVEFLDELKKFYLIVNLQVDPPMKVLFSNTEADQKKIEHWVYQNTTRSSKIILKQLDGLTYRVKTNALRYKDLEQLDELCQLRDNLSTYKQQVTSHIRKVEAITRATNAIQADLQYLQQHGYEKWVMQDDPVTKSDMQILQFGHQARTLKYRKTQYNGFYYCKSVVTPHKDHWISKEAAFEKVSFLSEKKKEELVQGAHLSTLCIMVETHDLEQLKTLKTSEADYATHIQKTMMEAAIIVICSIINPRITEAQLVRGLFHKILPMMDIHTVCMWKIFILIIKYGARHYNKDN